MTSGEAAREERRRGGLLPQPLPVSELAEDGVVAGVPVRVFTPPEARAVYLHLHGGGFVYGSSRLQDDVLERTALACGVALVSVEYRLAPEHPYPAAPDDCEAVALALVERESRPLAIGGESAGANLAVTTLLRLRDRHGVLAFTAAALSFGVYDLALTQFTDERDPSLTREELTRLVTDYAGGAPLDDGDLSPVRADLHGLPDALFVVGSRDPLLHDSSLMARRWREAGNHARLEVVPGAQHGLDSSEHVNAFLRGRLDPE